MDRLFLQFIFSVRREYSSGTYFEIISADAEASRELGVMGGFVCQN